MIIPNKRRGAKSAETTQRPAGNHAKPEGSPPVSADSASPRSSVPEKSVIVWLKNVEAIGAVLGLKFYAPRQKKRLQQLEDLRAVTACHDFPPKDKAKGYWPRQAVVTWLQTNVKLAGNKRSFALVECDGGRGTCDKGSTGLASSPDTRHTPLPAGDLPPQANAPSGGEDDLFGETSAAEKYKARLRFNLDIYLNPHLHPTASGGVMKLRGDEIKELKAAGMLPAVAAENEDEYLVGPNITGGFRGMAGYILNNFKLLVSHTSIQNWVIGNTLPDGCRENFPAPEARGSNRWKKALVDPWIIKYLRPGSQQPGLTGTTVLDDRSRKEKADADVAEMEADLMRRQLSTKYLETVTVEGFIEGFGTWIGQQQDKFIEGTHGVRRIVRTVLETILQGSVTPEQLAIIDTQLLASLAAGNDEMKVAAGHQAGDLLSQLKKEREETVRAAQAT